MANELPVRFVTDAYLRSGSFTAGDGCVVGHWAGDDSDGALRFTNVDIGRNQAINFCLLRYIYSSVGDGSGSWKYSCRGINEDNTASFGDPFGRPKTTARIDVDEGRPTMGGSQRLDVKNIVQEIVNRNNWNRNNAVGFILEDQGSSTNVYAFADLSASYLVYRIESEPNFTPSPITIAAPTFPAVDDFGIKISFPEKDVLTAAEHDLLYTSRKEVTKIKQEAEVSTTGGVTKLIAHGLSYKPECVVFLRKNNLSFELPRIFGTAASDPVGGGVQGYYSVDSTYLRIYTYANASVYYYILLDEQAT